MALCEFGGHCIAAIESGWSGRDIEVVKGRASRDRKPGIWKAIAMSSKMVREIYVRTSSFKVATLAVYINVVDGKGGLDSKTFQISMYLKSSPSRERGKVDPRRHLATVGAAD